MSQASQQRSRRAAIKRTLSVDNLDVKVQSQSVSLESLLTGKPNGDFVVVNSKQRRKQRQVQSQNCQTSQPQLQSQGST